mgnify:CR=1 FL=1
MGESYVECMVSRKASGLLGALKFLLGAVALICFLIGTVFWVSMILAVVAGAGAYFANMYAKLEYEYLYVDREITVDKILNRSRRKKVEKLEVDRMEIFAPIRSWHLDSMKNRQFKTVDYSSGIAGQPDRRYVMIYNGERKVIFEPSEAFVKALQSVAPRKVFLD